MIYHVAEAGIAPASGGYEPPEILLLYPAEELSTEMKKKSSHYLGNDA